MTVFGALRIKNEGRWIKEVLQSILPLCERVFVLDDHSTDATDEICERFDDRVTLIRSSFEGLDETRDKSFLLQRVMGCVSDIHLRGDEKSPFWCLAIDGDEVLEHGAVTMIQSLLPTTKAHAFKLPILYLWDNRQQIRTDGVYRTFARPSLFRLMNRGFDYQRTPWGGNFHCSSIPQQLLHHAHEPINARILHLGYMDKADRLRKYEWYNSIDPNNVPEDGYRHMVIGDVFPPDSKFRHAGPLRLEAL